MKTYTPNFGTLMEKACRHLERLRKGRPDRVLPSCGWAPALNPQRLKCLPSRVRSVPSGHSSALTPGAVWLGLGVTGDLTQPWGNSFLLTRCVGQSLPDLKPNLPCLVCGHFPVWWQSQRNQSKNKIVPSSPQGLKHPPQRVRRWNPSSIVCSPCKSLYLSRPQFLHL